MDSEFCGGCVYKRGFGVDASCDYIGVTGRPRPCPGGRGCTVKTLEGDEAKMPRQMTFDEEKALTLHGEGRSDGEIADAVGASRTAISSWRNRRGLARNMPPLKSGTRPEVTVEIPPGLRSAARREPPSGSGGKDEANTDNSSGGG